MRVGNEGPEPPTTVQPRLFQPVAPNRGSSRSGLGLSRVKQLTDDMEGIISCRIGTTGTLFRILLPTTVDEPGSL
ncbi:hypothetical protein N6L25_08800 [Marinobacter sp. SS21]|nr:ATP-binding protein [Marinobacter sp. SS21]MDC0662656.1 hypothetical protein [Marinobacter sp. SS21]